MDAKLERPDDDDDVTAGPRLRATDRELLCVKTTFSFSAKHTHASDLSVLVADLLSTTPSLTASTSFPLLPSIKHQSTAVY